jgi:hypothetical protein
MLMLKTPIQEQVPIIIIALDPFCVAIWERNR